MKHSFLSLMILVLLMFSCTEHDVELKSQELDLSKNPDLGRVLFYDPQLSLNNTISCSSCHKQELAFADNVSFSVGFEDKLTVRNSMPIQNLSIFSNSPLFWDGREHNLSSMVLRPIENHIEMGFEDISELEDKLSQISYYPELFQNKFGSTVIDKQKIGVALAEFLSSITSLNTKLDNSNNIGESLNAIEQQGKELFTNVYNCNSCHQVQSPDGYLFAGVFANIGLEQEYSDNGLGEVVILGDSINTSNANGKFKIPSLRNVALTAPYMHDGRFNTLEEVINFYNNGVNDHPNLDLRLRAFDGRVNRPQITEYEKKAIIAFLNTLTDYEMITNPVFSNPFETK